MKTVRRDSLITTVWRFTFGLTQGRCPSIALCVREHSHSQVIVKDIDVLQNSCAEGPEANTCKYRDSHRSSSTFIISWCVWLQKRYNYAIWTTKTQLLELKFKDLRIMTIVNHAKSISLKDWFLDQCNVFNFEILCCFLLTTLPATRGVTGVEGNCVIKYYFMGPCRVRFQDAFSQQNLLI